MANELISNDCLLVQTARCPRAGNWHTDHLLFFSHCLAQCLRELVLTSSLSLVKRMLYCFFEKSKFGICKNKKKGWVGVSKLLGSWQMFLLIVQ